MPFHEGHQRAPGGARDRQLLRALIDTRVGVVSTMALLVAVLVIASLLR